MGLSLASAIIGLAVVIAGLLLLIIRKQWPVAIACFVIGLALIFVPYTFIYVFLR